MKRMICLCVLAAGWTGCAVVGTNPEAILNEWLGGNPPADTGGPDQQNGTETGSAGGAVGTAAPADSPAAVFANVPGIPQAGARTRDLGGALSIRVLSRSRTAADVTIRFTIDVVTVHLAELHVDPFATAGIVGPDAAVRAEITGAYVTGRPTPPLTLVLGESFEAGDEKTYIIPDPDDACPDDPDKFEPGICGCGIPDMDADNDGTADCNDACPDDPAKTAPGACGCGKPDVDSDGDGTADCADDCPQDPAKIAPGACGCGKPDTDSNRDGIPDCLSPPAPPPPPPPPAQTYKLVVAVSPADAGTVMRSPDAAAYPAGTSVTLTAIATNGYAFDYWALPGGGSATQTAITIVMSSDQFVSACFRPASTGASRLYVNSGASSRGDGTSWATAFRDLADALDAAQSRAGSDTPVEIWVAAGTYVPDRGTGDRSRTFALRNHVAIYGGFAGTETSRLDRDPQTRRTILSGDLSRNDDRFYNNAENAYHVVSGSGVDASAILDGFTITGGNADDRYAGSEGGGLYIDDGSPTIQNCVFEYNSGWNAGGVFVSGDSPAFHNCLFQQNAGRNGGALEAFGGRTTLTACSFVANEGGYGAAALFVGGEPMLLGCMFVGSHAAADDYGQGGGILASAAALTMANCTFEGNSADAEGGAVCLENSTAQLTNCSFFGNAAGAGGGLANVGGSALLVNCLFSGNRATDEGGGGVYVVGPDANTDLINCTFSGNLAPSGDGGGLNSSGVKEPTIANCIFWGNSALAGPQIRGTVALSYSCVEGGAAGSGIIQSDPRFVNAVGADGTVGTADDDLRLRPDSPCIDAGDTLLVPPTVATDLDGNARFRDDACTPDTGNTTGDRPVVDMGAYEYVPPPDGCQP